jgi:hypothetical protein
MTYIPFPDISPEIFAIDIGPVTLALRWYALAYIVGLIAGWKLIVRMVTTPRLWPGAAPAQAEQIERLLTWVIVGVILGGRVGYVLFYDLAGFAIDPARILRVWEGGMSFSWVGLPISSMPSFGAAPPPYLGAWHFRAMRRNPAPLPTCPVSATQASFMRRGWRGFCSWSSSPT